MKPFEYLVYQKEKLNKDGETVVEARVLVQPTLVLARSTEAVQFIAARSIPEDQIEDADLIEIVVRPF